MEQGMAPVWWEGMVGGALVARLLRLQTKLEMQLMAFRKLQLLRPRFPKTTGTYSGR
jgi:hypothetical protein